MKGELWQERKRAVKSRNNSRENQTSTVKSAERVDRGQEAIKTGFALNVGRQLGFAAESANADLSSDDALAEFEKPHRDGDVA